MNLNECVTCKHARNMHHSYFQYCQVTGCKCPHFMDMKDSLMQGVRYDHETGKVIKTEREPGQ